MSTFIEYANNLNPILELSKLGSDEKSYSWSIENVLTIPVNIDFSDLCDSPLACTNVADDVASNYSEATSNYPSLNASPRTGGSNATTIPTLTSMNSSSQNGSLAGSSSLIPNSSLMPSHFSHESYWQALLDRSSFHSSVSDRLDMNQLGHFPREPRVNQSKLENTDTCSRVLQDAQSFGEHMNSHSKEPKRNGKRNQSLDIILSSRMDKFKKSKNNSGNASYGSAPTKANSISDEQQPIMHQRRKDSERQIMANNASGSTTSTSKNDKRKEPQV